MRLRSWLSVCLGASLPLAAHAGGIAERAVPASVAAGTAQRLGPAATTTPVHIAVSLQLRDRPGLATLAHSVSNPDSPLYRHYITPAQFADRFGPAAADYQAAADFFRAQGLTVDASAANRFLIGLDGTAAQFQRVFHVTLNQYRAASGRIFTAPDREPTVSAPLKLLEVSGMDDEIAPTPRLVASGAEKPGPSGSGSGPNGLFLGSDMRAAYYGSGPLTGAGQVVGMMELQPYNPAALSYYFTTVGQQLNVPLITIAAGTHAPTCTTCSAGEQSLDIEYAISVAPALNAMEVYVGGPEETLNSMASRDTASVLSTSWGWEKRFATDDTLFLELAAQGQTLLTATGDYSTLLASGPWPEEDANIIGVGGTNLTTASPGGAWKAEKGWASSAGGPSVDHQIKIEKYQVPYVTAANKASSRLRNLPDIAASAAINMFFCIAGRCGYAGGTSFASPIWAGFVALANQRAAQFGQPPVGFINPLLYKIGMKALADGAIHDITFGTSGKYSAVAGYDLVTGLGTPSADLIPLMATR